VRTSTICDPFNKCVRPYKVVVCGEKIVARLRLDQHSRDADMRDEAATGSRELRLVCTGPKPGLIYSVAVPSSLNRTSTANDSSSVTASVVDANASRSRSVSCSSLSNHAGLKTLSSPTTPRVHEDAQSLDDSGWSIEGQLETDTLKPPKKQCEAGTAPIPLQLWMQLEEKENENEIFKDAEPFLEEARSKSATRQDLTTRESIHHSRGRPSCVWFHEPGEATGNLLLREENEPDIIIRMPIPVPISQAEQQHFGLHQASLVLAFLFLLAVLSSMGAEAPISLAGDSFPL